MKNRPILTDINALAAAQPALEDFGPNSPRPYLAFELGRAKAELGPWLRRLPCPVIGIGVGALSKECDIVLKDLKRLAQLSQNIARAPLAAMVLVQHLRASETLSLDDALTAESFAFSAVQTGAEFRRWRESHNKGQLPQFTTPPLILKTQPGGALSIILNRAATRNAIGVEMRDALCEALDLAIVLKSKRVDISARGPAFSIGGAIEEFGEVTDPAFAHWIRSLRLPAARLARLEAGALHVHINGAAIGAGVEIAAFGYHVSAASKAWFQLPELKYGLIPGAGGTAALPRRIGRQRTAYMALSMEKVRAKTALEWGLIDEIIEADYAPLPAA
jgi:enoyl-CoA hydratase/carnithine racemase